MDGRALVPAVPDPSAAEDSVHQGVQQKVDGEHEYGRPGGDHGDHSQGRTAKRGRDVHGQRRGRGHRNVGAQARSARAHSARQR